MRNLRSLLWIFVAILSWEGQATTEVLWIRVNVNHSYRDLSVDCSAIQPGGEVFFAAEHDSGQLRRVVFNNFPYTDPYISIHKSILLTPQEVAGIRLHRDPKGRLWLKELPLTERLVKWVLYYGSHTYSYCSLPQWPRTMVPTFVPYQFDTEGVDAGILISDSQKVTFAGIRDDGAPFQATMRLTQRQFKWGGEND